ncbi:unnamed protein product [Adineta steineri]|uniref:Uncharacterized protein n=1 Tax=Adineta steineri TaxID=433720 RepID=A0A819G799_9BILA|nr:unnamed protein product [Adineta steineri]CAF3879722.1 unnamed protein product [Adineta steineri]
MSFLTIPVELVFRILDQQNDFTILCSMRNTLISVNLQSNKIGTVKVQRLADALRHNTTVITLNLRLTQTGDVGAQHLADALQNNMTLITLELAQNKINHKFEDIIIKLIDRNQKLQ